MQVILLFLLLCFSIYGKDPQILIEGCVDVESGALILKSEDHFLKPYTELVLYGTPQDKTQYVYTTVDVSDYTYQLQDDNPQLIRIDPFTFKLITSEKTERIYRKAYVVDHNLHFLLQSETLQDGSVRTYEYDQHHKIRSIKCGQRSWQFHHGEAHLDVISNGDKATYEFDGPRLIKHPSFLIDYTDDGKVSELKSPSGEILEEFLYSPDQTEVLHKGGNKTRYEFGDPEYPIRVEEFNPPSILLYNEKGNPVFEKTPAMEIRRQYDDNHILTRVTIDDLRVIEIEGGEEHPAVILEKANDLLLRKTTYQYGATILEAIYNPDGSLCLKRTIAQSAIHRPWKVTFPIGTSIENGIEVERDYFGRIIAKKGDGWSETYDYNALHLISKTDPMGIVTSYSYDEQGHKQKETIKTSFGDIETLFSHDALGRVTKVQTGDLCTLYRYDEKDRVIEKKEKDLQGTLIRHISFLYENNEVLVKQKTNQGTVTYPLPKHNPAHSDRKNDTYYTIEYNRRGQPTRIVDPEHNLIEIRTYDDLGNLTEETLSNGLTLKKSYDHRSRPIQLTLPDESVIYYRWGPKYLEEIRRITNKEKYEYNHDFQEYDLAGFPIRQRLIEGFGEISYELNEHLCIAAVLSRHFDQRADEISRIDLPPNTKNNTYRCDKLGRIVEIDQPKRKLLFTYDYWNRRMTKRVVEFLDDIWQETSHLAFIYDDMQEIGAMDLTENTLKQLRVLAPHPINPGDHAIAYELEGMPYVPIHDLHGNVKKLLSVIRRKVMETYTHALSGREKIVDYWGDVIPESKAGNPWRFKCQRIDEETGLLFIDGDYYDTHHQTFLQDRTKSLPSLQLFSLPRESYTTLRQVL